MLRYERIFERIFHCHVETMDGTRMDGTRVDGMNKHLVGVFSPYPSEKYELVNWMIVPNIWENIKCSKPPTSIQLTMLNIRVLTIAKRNGLLFNALVLANITHRPRGLPKPRIA